MIFQKKENLKILLFLIPLSYIIGIGVTEFFIFISIIFFIFLNKDKSLFVDSKIIFFTPFFFICSYKFISTNYR